ncbi:hypothetical protein [Candidatus Kuenenia stuttgartiensis]|uniref:hypothetical protein n=1 Tax=Kuenenia stuttgartiensis TaxID=174633 RepID=UPI0012FF5733|nr:hypothetical protein [Candidatus Kuenenia stuttgartiensis]
MAIHVINLQDFLRRQFHPLNPPPAGDRLTTSLAGFHALVGLILWSKLRCIPGFL